jgi:cellulose synthase/poly-beta-1,6-N-acetylglucosamine synthase-like glycosyltransferase
MTSLSIVLAALLGLLAAVLLLPTLADCVSLIKIVFSRAAARRRSEPALPRLLVLVPAHNEQMMVGACIESLLRMQYPVQRREIVVIADNCADGTAAAARAAGAQCLERRDHVRPGKPRAIAWALESLSLDSYDAVVIVDADTVVARDFAAGLAAAAPLNDKALQAFFDVENVAETALTRLAAVLASANHRFAYPLKQRAGVNTPLMGNGMCIGTEVLRTHGWTAFCIAEDWELYAQLTTRGVRIESAPSAVLYAQEAHTLRQSLTQRQRWTAGKLTVLGRYSAQLMRSRHVSLRQKLDSIGELSAPGPVLHLGFATLGAGTAYLLGSVWIASLLLATLVRQCVYAMLALRVQPDPGKALVAFAFLPVYALWRMGTAAGALSMLGDKPWIRTQRHAVAAAGETRAAVERT